MRRFRELRVAPVLAFLAGLLIATAGTATAAKLITGKQIKDGSVTAQDLSKSLRAQLSKSAVPGPAGAPGAPGAAGPAGTAMAFALVPAAGGVDVASSKNVAPGNVTHPSTGVYCLSGLNPAPRNAVASVAITPGDGYSVFAGLTTDAAAIAGCPGGTQVSVVVGSQDGFRVNDSFMIQLN